MNSSIIVHIVLERNMAVKAEKTAGNLLNSSLETPLVKTGDQRTQKLVMNAATAAANQRHLRDAIVPAEKSAASDLAKSHSNLWDSLFAKHEGKVYIYPVIQTNSNFWFTFFPTDNRRLA
jgi:hypothetical protein